MEESTFAKRVNVITPPGEGQPQWRSQRCSLHPLPTVTTLYLLLHGIRFQKRLRADREARQMSFGLDIKIDHADGYTTWIEVVDGQTYNLSPMWRRGCMIPEDEGTRWFDDKTCVELQPVLLKAIEDYVVNREAYEELDPPNGWGDHEGYFSTLLRFARLVHKHPTGTVRWNG